MNREPSLLFAEIRRLTREVHRWRTATTRWRKRACFLGGVAAACLLCWVAVYGFLSAHWLADHGYDRAIAETIVAAAHRLSEEIWSTTQAIAGGDRRP